MFFSDIFSVLFFLFINSFFLHLLLMNILKKRRDFHVTIISIASFAIDIFFFNIGQ